MELILWRHAEAVEGYPDAARNLTAKGRKQAQKVGRWLAPRLSRHVRILSSPTQRTRQTADGLGLPYETSDAIAPGADAPAVLRAAGWPDGDRDVLIIGHQPTLGEVAALLLVGEARPLSIRKGAIWWFVGREGGDARGASLRMVVGPEALD